MDEFEFKVNGETFFADQQAVDAAVLLRTAFAGKAIVKHPETMIEKFTKGANLVERLF